jgi:putative restriction endonuclease
MMAKQPEFRKYLPLEEWFRNQSGTAEPIELTFDQVEEILGTPLPKSATKLKTWWTNVQPKIQSHRTAWLNNGWTVSEFDQGARRVKFVRARP